MTINVNEDELVLLIQLVLARVVEAEQGEPLPFANQLLQKLLATKEDVIVRTKS